MNPAQRLTVAIGGALLVISAFFAPYNWVNITPDGVDSEPRDAGYHFALTPPRTNVHGEDSRIDFTRLVYEWIVVMSGTAGFFFVFRDRAK